MGGSYPGMRTAFMRHLYPEIIFAGYSSSAPVEAKVDMGSYWEPMVRGMVHYGSGNCSKDIHAAIGYIDQELDKGGEAAANLKVQFLGGGADKNSNGAFASGLASLFYQWQSYGIGGSPHSVGEFCEYLETDPRNNTVAGPDGWAVSRGAKYVADRWASWPKFAGIASGFGNTDCSGNVNVTADCNLDFLYTDPNDIGWRWLYCTQFGRFPPFFSYQVTQRTLIITPTTILSTTLTSRQAAYNPRTSAPPKSFQNTTPSSTNRTSATANSQMPRRLSSQSGRRPTTTTPSSAAGTFAHRSSTGPPENSIRGARSRLSQRSPAHRTPSPSPIRPSAARVSPWTRYSAMCSQMRRMSMILGSRRNQVLITFLRRWMGG